MADLRPTRSPNSHAESEHKDTQSPRTRRVGFLSNVAIRISRGSISTANDDKGKHASLREKSTFGILADEETDEVPGTVLLLTQTRNEPLGYDQMETHREDVETLSRRRSRSLSAPPPQKKTPDGLIVLDPQPEDTPNDPLNWPAWRRDAALLSLGYYCMLGGGMTPILAAGFNNVAQTYSVSYSDVALTTGLYMMGLGVGSVIFSPTAILWGKRPVYLLGAILFVLSAVWCALAPSYAQLVIARVFQGIAVSPVECLPSSTIAEIFFLHERAFRIGIYTLLLLGGKNLIPLVSAAIIQSLDWRWVFWIVAVCVGFGGILLFLFVPETFWDRTPRPHRKRRTRSRSRSRSRASFSSRMKDTWRPSFVRKATERSQPRLEIDPPTNEKTTNEAVTSPQSTVSKPEATHIFDGTRPMKLSMPLNGAFEQASNVPHLHNLNSPYYSELEKGDDYFSQATSPQPLSSPPHKADAALTGPGHTGDAQSSPTLPSRGRGAISPAQTNPSQSPTLSRGPVMLYTTELRNAPAQPWSKTLKPFNGRISKAKWWRVACRPFVLYAYPSVLWSAMVYSLSVGWLIVLSESATDIFKNRDRYNFSSIETGLVYLAPFIGGVLGTAVAGKLSDVIVRFMARRNGGIYEPEFRLVMAIPITITTAIGLMGYGWSAQERDNFMVPTIFFGIISFGCCVGSTTSITFCVDSYRQFSGEALVTLNFSKNVFHGLVWSLFFPAWLQDDGPKLVFLVIGGIQIACMLTTIPMYIYGKRARMWTVRKRMMERL